MLQNARRNSSQFACPSGVDQVNKVFKNGDKYTGGWKSGRPQGEGSYQWFDGSAYKGNWKDGQKDGLGTYTWPSGARYHGEWVAGCMHGVGTFESPDGTSYQGSWYRDMKQGLGRKVFINRDVYEGLWRENRCHGPGRYRWTNRDEYDGEWSMGMMEGRGTLRWKTGDRYDGEFVRGYEDGLGIFTWKNGSTYDGFWSSGFKHGLGVYRPAPPDASAKQRPTSEHVAQNSSLDSINRRDFPRPSVDELRKGQSGVRLNGLAGITAGERTCEEIFGGIFEQPVPQHDLHEIAQGDTLAGASLGHIVESGHAERILVREYDIGMLLREQVLTAEELEAVFGKDDRRKRQQERWPRGEKNSERPGENIYKGHRSYDLMLNLQLGIRFAVGRVSADYNVKQLLPEHFRATRVQSFPRDGCRHTPPHPTSDFIWKDYCPAAFRKLRDVFSIDRADFMTSICGDQALRELPSPGKSGSVFFLSHDDRYIIKTVRKGEVKTLLELLQRYVEHVQKYPHTLLIKFYGLYRVSPAQGAKVRFIVMNNLFQTDLPIHRKYDLKGSTLGRFSTQTPGPNVILKDQNLDIRLILDSDWHQKLMKQLEMDCQLMQDLHVMDYSLLIGIHFKSAAQLAGTQTASKGEEAEEEETNEGERPSIDLSAAPTPTAAANGFHHDDFGKLYEGGAAESVALESFKAAHAEAEAKRLEKQWRARITRRLGPKVDEQKMSDLIKLAQFRMLSREPKLRTPTMVLACRNTDNKRTSTLSAASKLQATDELTQRLGGSRVQLGMNMQVTCLPQAGRAKAAPEDALCYFGIIDILQDYNMSKRLEHSIKSLRHGSQVISAVDPRTYSLRFQEFMKKLFN